jgi:hypothetical protein
MIKFRDSKGKLRFWPIYWTYYGVFVAPLMIINLFVDEKTDIGQALSLMQLVSLLPLGLLLCWQMYDMNKDHKRWTAMWKEEMEAMKNWDENTPAKLKEIRERYKLRES